MKTMTSVDGFLNILKWRKIRQDQLIDAIEERIKEEIDKIPLEELNILREPDYAIVVEFKIFNTESINSPFIRYVVDKYEKNAGWKIETSILVRSEPQRLFLRIKLSIPI